MNQQTPHLDAPMPNTDAASDLSRKDRKSASKLARWKEEQFTNGQGIRQQHMRAWIGVLSIMRGIHYYRIENGGWKPIRKNPNRERAVVPVMVPKYKTELGRLNSNIIGATSTPKSGYDSKAFYASQRAQAVLDQWHIDANVPQFFDEANQMLLMYGTVGYYRYVDRFNQTPKMKAIPGHELYPIPYDAKTMESADGIMRVQMVSEEWLEMQDELAERETGQKPNRPMAREAGKMSTTMSMASLGFGGRGRISNSMVKAATCYTVWMKPNPLNPHGQWMLFINDTLYRYRGGPNDHEQTRALFGGKLPIEVVHYTKHADDFLAEGFCEQLISAQREQNRQMSTIIQSAKANQPMTFIDTDVTAWNDIGSRPDGLIPFKSHGMTGARAPAFHFPAAPLNRDVGATLGIVADFADQAVNHDSGIISGQQEGRTDGGPATRLLDANAKAPLQPVIDRIYGAWKRTYPDILDMCNEVWPEGKKVTVMGKQNFGREVMINKMDHPPSRDVIIEPVPLLVNGRNAMVQFVMQMRQMPSDDGKGFEVSSREMRKSLRVMGMSPPGIEISDEAEQRILFRIEMLINDTKKPAIAPANLMTSPEMKFENHKLAVELLKGALLDPSYMMYEQPVKQALLMELQFHLEILTQAGPSNFDNDLDEMDGDMSERHLYTAEQDFGSMEGQVSINGAPVGL